MLKSGIRWRWVVNSTPLPLYPRGRIAVLIQREAVLAPEQVWTFLWGEKCLQPTGISAPDRPASSVVAIPTKLLRLPNAEVKKELPQYWLSRKTVVIVVNSWGSPSVAASRARAHTHNTHTHTHTHTHTELLLYQDSIRGFCLSGTRHYVIYRKPGTLSYTAAKISKFARYICINFVFHHRKLVTAKHLLILSCMRHIKFYMEVKTGFLTLQ